MITYTDTTIFNAGAQTIVNTINCVGVMGAGLALECKLRFPKMYEDYVERCKHKRVEIGRPYVYRGYETPWIMNFSTKNHWRYPSKIEWIEQGLDYFVQKYEQGRITSIAFPKLGCDKGGLNWDNVQSVMEKYLKKIDIDVYICLDKERQASGIEGIMIDLLNNQSHNFLVEQLGIRDDIFSKIRNVLPIYRFRDLSKIAGVGKETYQEIFKFLYSTATKQETDSFKPVDLEEARPKMGDSVLTKPLIEISYVSRGSIQEESQASPESELEIPNNIEKEDNIFEDWVLPRLENLLQVPQSLEDILEKFKTVNNKQMQDWLKLGVELGKVKKLQKPVRYSWYSVGQDKSAASKNRINKPKNPKKTQSKSSSKHKLSASQDGVQLSLI